MPFPTFDEMIDPLLRVLAEAGSGLDAHTAHDRIADRMRLSEADRALTLPSGAQALYRNRAGWAHDRLKRARLSSSPKRGFWQLTPAGLAFVRAHPKPLTEAEAWALAVPRKDSRADGEGDGEPSSDQTVTVAPAREPDDRPQRRRDAQAGECTAGRQRLFRRRIGPIGAPAHGAPGAVTELGAGDGTYRTVGATAAGRHVVSDS